MIAEGPSQGTKNTKTRHGRGIERSKHSPFQKLPLSNTPPFKNYTHARLNVRTHIRVHTCTTITHMYTYTFIISMQSYSRQISRETLYAWGNPLLLNCGTCYSVLSFCSFIHDSQPHEERRCYTSHGSVISCCGADEVSQLIDSECRL